MINYLRVAIVFLVFGYAETIVDFILNIMGW